MNFTLIFLGPVLIDLPKDVTAGTLNKPPTPQTKHFLTEEMKSGKFSAKDIEHAAR